MSEPSPRPWTSPRDHYGTPLVDANGVDVIEPQWTNDDGPFYPEISEADAALIVRAVNTHDDLVDMLEEFEWLYDHETDIGQAFCQICGGQQPMETWPDAKGYKADCELAVLLKAAGRSVEIDGV